MITLGEVNEARATAENLKINWLMERGWKYTSDWPDCIWRWAKVLMWGQENNPKKALMATEDTAEAVRLECSSGVGKLVKFADDS